MFLKIGVLKHFAILAGRHPCFSLFLIKWQAWRVFLKTVFFIEHLWWLLLYVTSQNNCIEGSPPWHHPVKFGVHMHYGSGDMMSLICHVILLDLVINGSCDIWVRAPHHKSPTCQVWWP